MSGDSWITVDRAMESFTGRRWLEGFDECSCWHWISLLHFTRGSAREGDEVDPSCSLHGE